MKYQLTCPKCKYEFSYDNGYLDDNITRLGIEIQDLIIQLRNYKTLPKSEQRTKTSWCMNTKKALSIKQKQIAEFKAIRKICDQQKDKYAFQVFKNLVRETVGEEEYHKLIKKMDAELEAYRISDMSYHQYTRSNSKCGVTSINKI